MKAKSIEKLLSGIHTKLIDSIDDKEIKEIIEENTFITGGCIPSMLIDEFVNDFDIYFLKKEDALSVKEYYKKILSDDKKKKDRKFYPKLITENSINLSDKIQLITKFTGEPEKVVDNFDWSHIKSYWTKKDGLKLDDIVYRLIVEKELIYTGSDYPLSSLLRTRKFLKKGWHISTETMINIILDTVESIYNKNLTKSNTDESVIDDININTGIIVEDNITKFSVEEILHQLNGVDPLTIQKELEEKTGQYLDVKEIINLIKR